MPTLALTVRDSAMRVSHDMVVEAGDTTLISALASRFAQALGWRTENEEGASLSFSLSVLNVGVLDPKLPLGSAGLVDGDVVLVGLASRGARGDYLVADTVETAARSSSGIEGLPAAEFRVVSGAGAGARLRVSRPVTLLGRGDDCNLRIAEDRAISWRHARVVYRASDYWIEDLGSANGTFVNGRSVSSERLSDGDVILLGSTSVAFVRP